jgi:Zn ribbon nucleic-acid-binding protein
MSEDEKWSKLYEVWKEKAKKKHGDRYTYLSYGDINYRGNKKKIPLICKVHGKFEMWSGDHLKGSGCRQCSIENQKMDTPKFIEKAKLKHGDKYLYDKVNYVNTAEPVIITCPTHGDFKQIPNGHLNGNGCKLCKYESFRDTKEEFIKKAKNIHGDLYDYSKIDYKNNYTNIDIICKEHGVFSQRPSDHLASRGCPRCGVVKSNEKKLKDKTWFITEARKVHGSVYDYSISNYTGYDNNIDIICKKHGKFTTTVRLHLAGSICKQCSYENLRSNTANFIKKSKKVHGELFDYSKSKYVDQLTKIEIVCKKHGSFWQTPESHYKQTGCPVCSESKGERKVRLWLKNNKIDYIREYKLSGHRYRYDFYLPELNILLEFHGLQHYQPIEHFGGLKTFKGVLKRDQHKRELAHLHNIPLIEVKYNVSDIEHQLLVKLSKIYKYRIKNKFYKNFLELCKGLGLPSNTKPKDVKQHLVYQK